jgi:signal transduction histidine kinase
MSGTHLDVTERILAEAVITRLNAELEERIVSRTEQRDAVARELEAFAYSVAHDVRTPLRAIDGFSAMVLDDDGGRLSAASVDHLERAREAAQRMGLLLDDLLGLSRVSRHELHRSRVDLSAQALEVAAEVAADFPGRAVELSIHEGMAAEADPALTRMIVRELLGNAWKFTGPRETAHVAVGVDDSGDQSVFFVRDDGAGFDVRSAAHLFGVFQRMHPSDQFPGHGIGLATVQRLVLRHGGRIWAEAELDKGATFFFTLPAPPATG